MSNTQGNLNTTAEVGIVEEGGSFPPFDSTTYPSQLLWLVLSFGVFYWVMSKVVLPRIGGILEDRRDRIAGDMAEASRLKQETDEAIASYESALAEARKKATTMAHDARSKVKAETESARAAAEEQLAAKLSESEQSISKITAESLSHVGEIAAETTGELVKALIGGRAPAKAEVAKAVDAALK
ncbi:ATP synthase subunit b 2 [Pseudovibrio sp. W64]|uniref:F0F1 ATP synthase subunit B n=1 Tax=unclassified Pseudovibrio TaxID=2627060 RepID=UPI0007AE86C8|nr:MULTISPECIES: F0F1 ATP synthase subunit B [unclassified Pseudovibrio]KZK85197.1 ATP synthase subunit b 2 [Pseudovibrio sp. Ad13]KZK90652.1 ATP synthase subunit b 2 [Pseudovibrio sp. W64]KZK91462.1 ATP synthase subunit b 2 [Pseudovibrio sp. Ad46]